MNKISDIMNHEPSKTEVLLRNDELVRHVYGNVADAVYQHYCTVNPLEIGLQPGLQPGLQLGSTIEDKYRYWTNVNQFLDDLHLVLYDKDSKYNLRKIEAENYYILCRLCIEKSFTICDLINMGRSDRCKKLGTELSHNILPQYIYYLRQIMEHSHWGTSQAQSQPHAQPQPQPQSQPHAQPPHQAGIINISLPSVPGKFFPMYIPTSAIIQAENFKPRPRCVKRPVTPVTVAPDESDDDFIPVNFYTVYREGTAPADVMRSIPPSHHVPRVTLAPNRPPPPPV